MAGLGGGGGGGSSYPISLSNARTDTTNPVFGGNTTFQFSSPFSSAGTNDQSARNTEAATATSAAAEGNLQQQTTPTISGSASGGDGGIASVVSPTMIYVIAGLAAVVALAYIFKHR